ncbi:MAG: signal peptidase II [Deltaproteobacteria bacterium]|nr:signal peptidase II [Deltaproteobacteria bacterium]
MTRAIAFRVLVFCVVVISDQLSKIAAVKYLSLGNSIEVFPGFFNLTLVYNPGAAFGLFQGLTDGVRHLALATSTILALIVIGVLAFRDLKNDSFSLAVLSAIFGAAIGNLIDRMRYDAVVDFLDFYWGEYHWPAFNVADSVISVGVCIVVARLFLSNSHCQQAKSSKYGCACQE